MTIRLNSNLDLTTIRENFVSNGYVRIDNVLDNDSAILLENALSRQIQWDVCYLTDNGPKSISQSELQAYTPEQMAALNLEIMKKATNGFSYYYYRSDLVNTRNPIAKEFFQYLSSPDFIGFARAVTGIPAIRQLNGQLARFSTACFLRTHSDKTDKEKRAAAYVFSFTSQWSTDWGGHLHILDNQSRNRDVFEPSFNTLTLFKVPTPHFVSQVSNYARGFRYTATGWMLE